jgi:hypothetical protein
MKSAALLLGLVGCGGFAPSGNYHRDHGEIIANEDDDIPYYASHEEALSNGFLVNPEAGAEICAGRVGPGQTCFVPITTTFTQRNNIPSNGGTIWFDAINDERDVVVNRLNNFGWNVTVVGLETPANWWTTVETVHPTVPGWVGATSYWVSAYVAAAEGGTFAYHWACKSSIYKQTIMNDVLWNAFGDNIRKIYVRDIIDHEMTHCSGPGHVTTSGDLMSPNAGGWRGSLLDPNATHMSWLDNYTGYNP